MLNEINIGKCTLDSWQNKFIERVKTEEVNYDPSHRLDHFKRVTALAITFSENENADLAVIIPASWLHDIVPIKKSSINRKNASKLSATAAIDYLRTLEYPEKYFENIAHTIEAHSFSAAIRPMTLEAKILQDADRLDAIGAIGIARCFSCGGSMDRPLYDMTDPYAQHRTPNDRLNTLDHFFQKLLLISGSMQTESGKREAYKRHKFLESFIKQLKSEVSVRV